MKYITLELKIMIPEGIDPAKAKRVLESGTCTIETVSRKEGAPHHAKLQAETAYALST